MMFKCLCSVGNLMIMTWSSRVHSRLHIYGVRIMIWGLGLSIKYSLKLRQPLHGHTDLFTFYALHRKITHIEQTARNHEHAVIKNLCFTLVRSTANVNSSVIYFVFLVSVDQCSSISVIPPTRSLFWPTVSTTFVWKQPCYSDRRSLSQ
jgi:hypothetical protein